MEPDNQQHPEIDPDIRPDLGLIKDSGESSPGRAGLSKEKAKSLETAEKRAGTTQGSDSSSVRNQEETSAGMGLYRPGGGQNDRGRTASVWQIAKKRGPLAAILTLGFGLPTIIAIIFSPALVLQQFAETLTGKFNDQLGALDVRSTLLLKKKYNSTLTKGTCGTTVKIRCKYRSIRENSGLAKRLENAGVKIEGDRSIVPGRVKPKSFTFDGKTIQAKDLLNEARKNPDLRKALRKGYDPLYAAFSDRNAADLRTRLGIRRASDVKASADEKKMNEDLKNTAAGENDIPADGKKLTEGKDKNGNTIYTDSDGNVYAEKDGVRINNLIDEAIGRGELAKKVGKAATKATVTGVLTSTAFGAGAIDSACTAWTMIRVAGFAAKYYQQRQLIRYGYEFMKIAHKQKSGDATPEEITFFADKLTSTNSEGKNALNSDGYNFAAYGDVFNPGNFDAETANLKKGNISDSDVEKIMIQNETSKYINGQLVSTSLMAKIANAITQSNSGTVSKADSVCKFTKSWKGQALVFGLAAAGAIAAFFTGGVSLSVGAIAQGAVSVAISVTFALLQPKLIDMAKGEVIKGDENGNETGNAVVSGIGGYNAQTAPASGLRPATQSSYAAYVKTANEVAAKFAAEDRAERSPFDPTSPNTFLGSVVAAITPFTSKMQTASSASIALPSLVTSSLASLGSGQKTYAADSTDQYKQCDDPEYKDLAADPFCNLRYASGELGTDPEVVLDYMIQHNQIVSDEDPTPLPGSEYEDFVNKCVNRQSSIGDKFISYSDGQSESGGDPEGGYQCVFGKQSKAIEHRNNMFSAFWIDTRANDGMDNDFDTGQAGVVGGVDLKVASFNVRGASHDGDNGTVSYVTRMQRTVDTVKNEGFDVIGFQEFETKQRKEFNNALGDTYTLSSNEAATDNGNAIAWNASKYDLVDHGTQPNLVYTVGNKLDAPWVKLRDKSTQQEFYFLNTHDPANVHDNPVTKNAARRTANAKEHVKFIQEKGADGTPVLMSGDFNSTFKKRDGDINVTAGNISETLPYCIMTGGGLQNAFDMYKKRSADCPNNEIDWSTEDPGKGCSTQIDHLYLVTGSQQPASIDEFSCVRKGDTQASVATGNGSDHDTVVFKVSIAGLATASGAALDFTAASYNMCQEINHASGGDKCPSISTKRQKIANVISGSTDIGNPALDIIGAQEVSQPTQKALLSSLSGYDSYPKQVPSSNGKAIFWNKGKFSSDGGGRLTGVHGNGSSDSIDNNSFPWVHLTSTGGRSLYVISIHSPNDGYGNPNDRYLNAQKILEWATQKQGDGSLVIVTGDFNNGTRTDGSHPGAYCYLTSTAVLQHAADMSDAKPASKQCPRNNVPIDQIYSSLNIAGTTASGWKRVNDGGSTSGTDHGPAFVTYHLPGASSVQNVSALGGSPINYSNPVYGGSAPDPSVIKADNGTYHVYATGGTNDNPFVHLTSTNLVDWKSAGRTLTNAPSWVKNGIHWAPDVAKVGSQYVLTFTSGTTSARKIAYAVGSSAAGPFTYKGVLVESGEFGSPDRYGTIDSHIFVDGSQPYLFFGGGVISVLKIKVASNGTITKDKGSRKILITRNSTGTTEGAFVHKHGNYYYLYYSYGDYASRSGATEYSTRIARSTSVMGPYEPKSPYKPLLTGKDPFRAPGHNSVVTDGQGNDWILYHALRSTGRTGSRMLMLDPIKYSSDGWPTVNDGHPSSGQTGVRNV